MEGLGEGHAGVEEGGDEHRDERLNGEAAPPRLCLEGTEQGFVFDGEGEVHGRPTAAGGSG